MKGNQSITKMQLYRLIQETQKINNKETNQTVTTNPFNANTILKQFLQMKMASILTKLRTIQSSSNEITEIPLNPNKNTLSLGTEMYDSLFTFTVDTPQVSYDPLVWNIIYAALPSDYTIPDPNFLNTLRTASATDS